jgi:hypothetical protein
MTGVRFDGTSDIRELRVLGEWAYMRTHITVTMTPPEGAPRGRGEVLKSARVLCTADGSDLTQRLVQGPVARGARREPSPRGGSHPEPGSQRKSKKLINSVGSPAVVTCNRHFPRKNCPTLAAPLLQKKI